MMIINTPTVPTISVGERGDAADMPVMVYAMFRKQLVDAAREHELLAALGDVRLHDANAAQRLARRPVTSAVIALRWRKIGRSRLNAIVMHAAERRAG